MQKGGAVPLTLLTELSTDLMTEIIHVYNMTAHNMTTENTAVGSDVLGKKECITENEDIQCKLNGASGRCIAQYTNKEGDMDVYVVTHLQQSKENITFRSEVTLAAPTTVLARETLVRMVPRVNQQLGCNGKSVWSIQHQPSMLETMETPFRVVDSVIAAQEEKDRHAASVEELILGNPVMKNRIRLDATPSESAHLVEVWSYEDINFYDPVKALFIDGYLATTTSPTGIAHAEALVHPAMVAHPTPTRALIMSMTPNAIVKELLKYKSIEHVSVVGSDASAATLIEEHMTSLNDCAFLAPEGSRHCMESAMVEVVKEDLNSWLCRKDKTPEIFDLIFVDVPIGKHEWLSVDIYEHFLKWSRGPDSDFVIVISAGSLPSLSKLIQRRCSVRGKILFVRQQEMKTMVVWVLILCCMTRYVSS